MRCPTGCYPDFPILSCRGCRRAKTQRVVAGSGAWRLLVEHGGRSGHAAERTGRVSTGGGMPTPVEAMTEILAKNPQDEAALVQRGNAWFQSGDIDNAIEDYTAVPVPRTMPGRTTTAGSLTPQRTISSRCWPITTPPSSGIRPTRPPTSTGAWSCTSAARRPTASRTCPRPSPWTRATQCRRSTAGSCILASA